MGSPVADAEIQDSFQYQPTAEEEGEGWGSDSHVESFTSNLTGSKKKKKRKKRSAVNIDVGYCLTVMKTTAYTEYYYCVTW